MTSSLDLPETILADVRILRAERDESFFREPNREAVIVVRINLRIGGLGGAALPAMLANDDRPSLAGANVFRYEQNPIGEYAGPDIEHHFVTPELRLVVNQFRAR